MRLPFFPRAKTRDEVAARLKKRGLKPIFWPDEARDGHVQVGDSLLWRRPGLISWAGNGQHSHAGIVDFGNRNGGYECLEVREFRGGRVTPLAEQVRQYPGRIDVYSPINMRLLARFAVADYMRGFVGCKYGWHSVLSAGVAHLPVVRWVIPRSNDDALARAWPPYCSEATAESYRLGPRQADRIDPVRRTPDCYTEPSDFARSLAFSYIGTLYPSEGLL